MNYLLSCCYKITYSYIVDPIWYLLYTPENTNKEYPIVLTDEYFIVAANDSLKIIDYTINGKKYKYISLSKEDTIDKNKLLVQQNKNGILYATINGKIDITNELKQFAGPYNNFYGKEFYTHWLKLLIPDAETVEILTMEGDSYEYKINLNENLNYFLKKPENNTGD